MRIIMEQMRVILAGFMVVTFKVLLVMQVVEVREYTLRAPWLMWVNIIWQLLWMQQRFVLMVMDYHSTDYTVPSGPS